MLPSPPRRPGRLYQDTVRHQGHTRTIQEDHTDDVRPDLDYVILSGSQDEAAGQYLRGKVVLRAPLSQKHPITGISLSLVGYHRVSYVNDQPISEAYRLTCCRCHRSQLPSPGTTRQSTILENDLPPLLLSNATRSPSRSTKCIAVYEWPFELLIPGKMPETTRGCYRCSIAYYLTARSIRTGSKTYPQALRAIRIIRTPPLSAFELMDALTVEGCSPSKFRYSASISHQAVALGTRIPTELGIQPMTPGLRLLAASCQLMEIHSIDDKHVAGNTNFATSHEICRWDLLDAAVKGLDAGVCIKRELPLPDVAAKCSPDVDAHGIRVSHAIHFDMLAEDVDGGEVKASCPWSAIPVREVLTPRVAARHPADCLVRFAAFTDQRIGSLR